MIREYIDFDPADYRLDGRLERHFNVTLKQDFGEFPNGKKFDECAVDCDGGVVWFRNFSKTHFYGMEDNIIPFIEEEYSAVIRLKIVSVTNCRIYLED